MAQRFTRSAAKRTVSDVSGTEELQQLSSPPETPPPRKRTPKAVSGQKSEPYTATKRRAKDLGSTTNTSRKRKRADAPQKESESPAIKMEDDLPTPSSARSKSKKNRKSEGLRTGEDVRAKVEQLASSTAHSPSKKSKSANYGLTPGESPYPDWPHPTPEECQEVVRLLSSIHGKVSAPKTIPTPSLTVSGCGEVPSVLDALVRTRLSAATNNNNSSRAFKGLVDTFGILDSGVGKGSVDWNAVRRAPQKEVFEAIKCGGLADVKSKDIKKILDMVYHENQERKGALLSESSKDNLGDAQPESKDEQQAEISRAESNVLSLDHLHLMSSEQAFDHLVRYPGIGPKTASCVLLFCLQRPSFAVDTHVFRLAKWLNWVPPEKATRNSTYAHCDARVPDDLKYPLHYLLIRHGRTCGRCRAVTGVSSKEWERANCPIEHLVKRTGIKKGGNVIAATPKKKKKGTKTAGRMDDVMDDESESELSDLGSDYSDE